MKKLIKTFKTLTKKKNLFSPFPKTLLKTFKPNFSQEPTKILLKKEKDSWSYELNEKKIKGISMDEKGNFMIIYTCKVCETRQSRSFTKNAYKNGIVILKCEGCQNLHLIADNLGWFQDGKVNIEDIVREGGGQLLKVEAKGEVQEFLIGKLGKREDKKKDMDLDMDTDKNTDK